MNIAKIAAVSAIALALSGCATTSRFDACNNARTSLLSGTGIYGAMGLVDSVEKVACDRRHSYVASHGELAPEVRGAILRGSITVGMTTRDVRAAWGDPYKINRYAAGELDQWVYGYVDYYYNFVPSQFVYVRDGVVTDWQSI